MGDRFSELDKDNDDRLSQSELRSALARSPGAHGATPPAGTTGCKALGRPAGAAAIPGDRRAAGRGARQQRCWQRCAQAGAAARESAMECGIAADMAVVARSLARGADPAPAGRRHHGAHLRRVGSQRGKELMRDIIEAAYGRDSASGGSVGPEVRRGAVHHLHEERRQHGSVLGRRLCAP